MRTLRAGLCVLPILVLGGCAINPGLPDERRVSIGEVIERVQCEMKAAYVANTVRHPWLRNWAAGYTLSLEREDKRGLDLNGSIISALNPGTFSLGGKVGLSETGTETGSVEFNFKLFALEKLDCESKPFDNRATYFTGSTGFEAWFQRVADGIDTRKTDLIDEPKAFGHSLTFKVSGSGSISPGWSLPTGSWGGSPAASRLDTYILKVGFTRIAGPPPIVQVEVTNFPAWLKAGEPLRSAPSDAKQAPVNQRRKPSALPAGTRLLRSPPLDAETQRSLERLIDRQGPNDLFRRQ
jgi:hypothetical protein